MRQKKLWILAGAITLAVVSLVPWHWHRPRNTPTLTTESVRKQIDQSLPVGSTRTEVESYLDSQSISHSYFDDPKFPNARRMEVARIIDISGSLFVTRTIQIGFHFDQSDRLIEFSVREFFTGQ